MKSLEEHTSVHLVWTCFLFPRFERGPFSGHIRVVVEVAGLYVLQSIVLEARLSRILISQCTKSLPNEVKGFIVTETIGTPRI